MAVITLSRCVAEQHRRGGGVTGRPDGGGPAGAHPQPAAGLPGGGGGPLLCRGDPGTARLQTRGLDPRRRAPQQHTEAAGACVRQELAFNRQLNSPLALFKVSFILCSMLA